MNEDESIAFLMRSADEIFGRMTSNSDKETLLMIHEYDGLPVDVLIMLLQYALSVGKCNMRYIEKMAIYAKIGVQEYWIVDLQRKIVIRYLKDNEFIPEMVSYSLFSSIPVHTYPNLEIDLSGIFE